MKDFIDKTSEQDGTPINRYAMMANQGFIGVETVFNSDGSIAETNAEGDTKTTTFPTHNQIVETFTGKEFTISKETTINNDGSVTEVIF